MIFLLLCLKNIFDHRKFTKDLQKQERHAHKCQDQMSFKNIQIVRKSRLFLSFANDTLMKNCTIKFKNKKKKE